MKIYILTLLSCLLIVFTIGCNEEPNDNMVDFQPDDFQYDDDKYGVLERALRDVLEKAPSEELTRDDLATLKRLSIPSVELNYGPFIGDLDLTLLAGCIHLTELNLSGSRISDIGPLAELRNLKALYLSHNRIVDTTPLKGLTQLEKLYLNHNQIIDLKPLVDNPGLVSERMSSAWVIIR